MFSEATRLLQLVAAQAEGPAGCPKDQLLLPLVMMAILYFVWLRPATKQQKEHKSMLEQLKRGDDGITQSGMLGKVADIEESIVSLEVARNVKIRVLKSTVSKRLKNDTSPAKDADAKADKAKG